MGRKGKEKNESLYERLVEDRCEDRRVVSKGHVPVLVGQGSSIEMFHVNVKLFNDPCMVALLEMAADELGDNREGILRITCDVDHFRRVISVISKVKS